MTANLHTELLRAILEAKIDLYNSEGRRRRQSDVLLEIGQRHDLFRSPDGTAFAKVGLAVYPVESRNYRDVLAEQFFRLVGSGADRNAIRDAVTTLSSIGKFGSDTRDVWTRVGRTKRCLTIDMGTDDWRVIEVDAQGWRWSREPAAFVRPRAQQALPEPAEANFDLLWKYLNVLPEHRPLVAGYMLAALRPSGPYPILFLAGEQGTGKSTAARVIRRLIDPSSSALRAPPKDIADLLIGALNGWVLCLDNLSYLGPQLSDGLCRLATGGSISGRALYTNTDEILVEVQRPVIVNGIDDLATRPDLAERGLHIELEVIQNRQPERVLWAEFDKDAPSIFGALLQALSMAIRDHRKVEISPLPRMADFALWAAAGMPELGFTAEEFTNAYRENQAIGLSVGIESSPVGRALLMFTGKRFGWSGTASQLLQDLNEMAGDGAIRSAAWPKTPSSLSNLLRRLAPALRSLGMEVKSERSAQVRILRLCSVPSGPSEPSSPSANLSEYCAE